MKFSEEIKQFRERLGMSQPAFGRLFRVSGQTISNWEVGRRAPWPSRQGDILDICQEKLDGEIAFSLRPGRAIDMGKWE